MPRLCQLLAATSVRGNLLNTSAVVRRRQTEPRPSSTPTSLVGTAGDGASVARGIPTREDSAQGNSG